MITLLLTHIDSGFIRAHMWTSTQTCGLEKSNVNQEESSWHGIRINVSNLSQDRLQFYFNCCFADHYILLSRQTCYFEFTQRRELSKCFVATSHLQYVDTNKSMPHWQIAKEKNWNKYDDYVFAYTKMWIDIDVRHFFILMNPQITMRGDQSKQGNLKIWNRKISNVIY